MRTILLVDDEEFVLDGIQRSISWETLGIDAVLTAQNGLQALELLSQKNIDIVITDVKMPIMDGIELLRQMQQKSYSCKVIVLSGYDDFTYAQAAIRYSVVDYLLKPIVLSKLKSAIEKAVLLSLEAESTETYLKALEQQFETYRPVLTEYFALQLLHGSINYSLADLLSFPVNIYGYQVILTHIDNFEIIQDVKTNIEETRRQIAVLDTLTCVQNFSFSKAKHITARVDGYDFALILLFTNKESTNTTTLQLEKLQQTLEHSTPYTFSFSLGNCYNSPEDISISYEQAREVMKSKVLYGNSCILTYSDLYMQDAVISLPTFYREKSCIYDCLRTRDRNALHIALQEILNHLKIAHVQNIDYIRQVAIELLTGATLFLYEQNEIPEKVICIYNNPISYVSKLETLDDIFSLVEDIYIQIIDYFDCKRKLKNQRTVARIREFVKENLSNEISLEAISHELQLTPNYIGALFRQSTNLYFSEYVMRERMERAKQLLSDPSCKIYEVASAVGYKNPTYFSKLFKEYTGLNPTEFKR